MCAVVGSAVTLLIHQKLAYIYCCTILFDGTCQFKIYLVKKPVFANGLHLTSDGHFWMRQHLLWHTAVKYEMSMT